MLVMKFGGTLMGDPKAIAHSASLAAASVRAGERVVVVVSAMSGVTETLLKIAASAEGGDIAFANDEIAILRSRHFGAAQALGAAPDSDAVREIRELLETLRQTVYGVYLLRELSPRTRDLIVSFGERLSAPLMDVALGGAGVRAHHLTGGAAGLTTDAHFGNARPLPGAYPRIRDRMSGLFEAGLTPVVTGFIGETEDGVITTLGRGGSDYTATILGAALGATEVWTWKDVDGVMSADPRFVPDARNLAHLSYHEVMELAYFGAKVLHPLAVTPLQERGTPLRVKSAADPDFPGTLVTSEAHADAAHPVKAVTAIRGATVLTIEGAGSFGAPDVLVDVFRVLARENLTVLMVSQSSSMSNVSLVIPRASGPHALASLKQEFGRDDRVRDFTLNEHVAVVAIVGEGMRGTKGVAAKLFGALAIEGVNLLMISQGSSELNISCAIDESDVDAALRAAHAAFDLGKERATA
ncbi:aspartate kinase [Deinococcus maricopensis]|uniref:Aspartokinase n=1 Tax=Deinococcus maricopensis (strain DSM 21211 / LMG 22137 / NRRL B-23946 / LB-34) TaxID=709986 RepID=E8U8T1_DEIML|nr:aspartate kinase [Deinococcus maricopensis DSM 21211]